MGSPSQATLAGAPRVTAHTSRRAQAFTTMVTRKSASPISISALRYRSSGGLAELIRNHAGHACSPAPDSDFDDLRPVADHHRHRHGLAQRAAQAQNDRAHDADARIAQHADADHLPARRAQRQHRLALHIGTAVITSRVSDEMIGRIMIARITPAASMP